MSAVVGFVFLIAALTLAPGLLRILIGLVLWTVVLAMVVLVAAPILTAVIGISML